MRDDTYTAEERATVEWLRSKLTCPIDWKAEIGIEPELDVSLDLQTWSWFQAIQLHQVRNEELDAATEFFDFGDLHRASDLKEMKTNLEERHPRMVAEYNRSMGRLHGLKFLPPSYNGKHFVVGATRSDVLKRTRSGGPSLFFEDINPKALASCFWDCIDFCFLLVDTPKNCLHIADPFLREGAMNIWNTIRTVHQLRIANNVMRPIGAVDGSEVSVIAFDIDLSAKTVHAYPITEQEGNNIMKEVNILAVQL